MSAFPIVNGTEVLIPAPEDYPYHLDFDNPRHDASTTRACNWLFAIEFLIGTAFFGQRVYTNGFLLRKFRIDDYFLTIAYLFSIVAQVLVVYMYNAKLFGVHAFEMTLDKHNWFQLMLTTATLVYIPTTIFSKLTLCVFYFRLSPATAYRYSVIVVAIICGGSLFAIWFAILFSCNPIEASWDARALLTAKCIDRPPIYITQAAFGSVTDLLLMIVPVPTLIGLQMNKRKKWGLVGFFSVGSITFVTSIVRLVLLLPTTTSTDQPWALSRGCIWVVIEANLLIMCGSLPTLRIFLSHVAPSVLGEGSTNNSSDYKGGSRSYGLRTFGAGDGKRKFDTLVELEHDVHFARDKDGLRPDDMTKSNVAVYGGRERRPSTDGGNITETGSEEGIVQTRTTTVSYSQR